MTNSWEFINGDWYYFNANGYMLTGWQEISGQWYYLNADGTMATNTWIGDYYVGADGQWKIAQWKADSNGWWYCHADGSYTRNDWEKIEGYWYLFDSNGWMLTGWQYVNRNWYYLQENGAMLDQGWHEINGDWYYMYSGGMMASNTWIGEYYVDSSGVRTSEIYGKEKKNVDAVKEKTRKLEERLQNEFLTQAEMNRISAQLYKAWDNEMNRLWNVLTENINSSVMAEVTRKQVQWINEREKSMEEAGNEFEGGSMEPLARYLEGADWTCKRVYELLEYLK